MKEKRREDKGFIQIPILIGIIVFVAVALVIGYGVIEYNKISNLTKEAHQLTEGEKYNEANKKLESAQNKPLVKNFGIKKQEINNEIAKNNELIKDKEKQEEEKQNQDLFSAQQKELEEAKNKIIINNQALVLDISGKGNTTKSQYEKQVLDYLDFLKFPKSLLGKMIIFIVFSDFQGPTIYFEDQPIPFNKPSKDVPAASGNFSYGPDSFNTIYIKSDYFPLNFYAPLTHELGHLIAKKLTADDWQRWASLRGNPTSGLHGIDMDWGISRVEDFAEVYKVVFGNHKGSDAEEWENHTAYGKKLYKEIYTEEEILKDFDLFYKVNNPSAKNFIDTLPSEAIITFIKEVLARYK